MRGRRYLIGCDAPQALLPFRRDGHGHGRTTGDPPKKAAPIDKAEADAAGAAVREAGVTLGLGYNRRFHPEMTKLRERILSGELESGSLVDENWFLTLERREFMGLLRNAKTQERVAHTLKTGKPLRN